MKKETIVTLFVVFILGVLIFFTMVPQGRTIFNQYVHGLKKADEISYENRRMVEDTARSMVASYVKDKATYEQYISSDNSEEQSWAKQAKMRANQTVASYNEYLLKNSYVWRDNIPPDISTRLEMIE